MKNVRPLVLWTCAVLLGLAAGLNYYHFVKGQAGPTDQQATEAGFSSAADLAVISELLDGPPIKSLTGHQFAVLDKYAHGPKFTPDYVLAVLLKLQDEATAARFVPAVARLRKERPDNVMALEMPNRWERSGCPVAANMLRQVGK